MPTGEPHVTDQSHGNDVRAARRFDQLTGNAAAAEQKRAAQPVLAGNGIQRPPRGFRLGPQRPLHAGRIQNPAPGRGEPGFSPQGQTSQPQQVRIHDEDAHQFGLQARRKRRRLFQSGPTVRRLVERDQNPPNGLTAHDSPSSRLRFIAASAIEASRVSMS